MMYIYRMSINATATEFRSQQSRYLDLAQREPVEILSRGARRRAVVVSPDFFDRAFEALEDAEDLRDAEAARQEDGFVSHEDLKRELGLS